MKRLMLALMRGCTDARLRDPEPGADGAAAPASPAPSAPAQDAPAATAPSEPSAAEPAADGSDGDLSSVTLGRADQPAPGGGEPAAQPAQDGARAPAKPDAQPAPQVKPEDYAAGVKLEDGVAGAGIDVDRGAMDAVAPVLMKHGVSVEAASELVNALARYQVEQFKARNAERFADNKRMHDAAVAKYSKVDFEYINAGIDSSFAPDGVMNYIVRNSEIGNDPEFLELMLAVGRTRPTNGSVGAAAGGQGTVGQSAGFQGISSAWK